MTSSLSGMRSNHLSYEPTVVASLRPAGFDLFGQPPENLDSRAAGPQPAKPTTLRQPMARNPAVYRHCRRCQPLRRGFREKSVGFEGVIFRA